MLKRNAQIIGISRSSINFFPGVPAGAHTATSRPASRGRHHRKVRPWCLRDVCCRLLLRVLAARRGRRNYRTAKLDLKQERAELVRIQRRLAELELARVEARTVDVTIIGAELTAEFAALKSRLRGIASKVAPCVALMDQTPLVADFILKEIDDVLDDLSSEEEIVKHAVSETRE